MYSVLTFSTLLGDRLLLLCLCTGDRDLRLGDLDLTLRLGDLDQDLLFGDLLLGDLDRLTGDLGRLLSRDLDLECRLTGDRGRLLKGERDFFRLCGEMEFFPLGRDFSGDDCFLGEVDFFSLLMGFPFTW